jgi:hypothetical protein
MPAGNKMTVPTRLMPNLSALSGTMAEVPANVSFKNAG